MYDIIFSMLKYYIELINGEFDIIFIKMLL